MSTAYHLEYRCDLSEVLDCILSEVLECILALLPTEWVVIDSFSDFRKHAGEDL